LELITAQTGSRLDPISDEMLALAEPGESTVATVRGWLLLGLGVLLILHGVAIGEFVEVAYGFTLLGIEPLARAHAEVVK
jgi:hypothetical protein